MKFVALAILVIALPVLVLLKRPAPAAKAAEAAELPSIKSEPAPAPKKAVEAKAVEAPKPEPPKPDPFVPVLQRLREAFAKGDASALESIRKELLALLVPADLPDAKNGAFAYLAAFKKMVSVDPNENAALAALAEGRALPEQVVLLKQLVAANAEAIALLKAAGDYESCRFAVDYAKGFNAELPHVGPLMKASRLLQAEALLAEMDGGRAVEDRCALSRLADSVAEEPLLISQLVRSYSLRQAGEGDPATVRSMVRPTLMMELCAAIQYGLEEMPRGALALPEVRQMAEHYVDCVLRAADLLQRPYYESRDALKELETRINFSGPEGEGSRMLMPAVVKLGEALSAAEAALRPPIDPFSGKPLLRKGGLLYSVGPDGIDNGGDPRLDQIIR